MPVKTSPAILALKFAAVSADHAFDRMATRAACAVAEKMQPTTTAARTRSVTDIWRSASAMRKAHAAAGLGWRKRSRRVAFCQSKAGETRPAIDALLHFLTDGGVMSPDSDISILLAGYRSPWLPSRRAGNLSIARAFEQHRIAVAHESVAMLDRVHVRASNRVMAAERAGEHQQRGSRQMEIRQQAIDDPEAITGRNEQRRFRRAGMNVACVIGGRLERPQARRADRNDASAARARGVDG